MEGYGVYVYSAVGTHPNDRYHMHACHARVHGCGLCVRGPNKATVTDPCAPGMKGVITKAYDKVRVCTSTDPAAFSWASGCRARCMDQAS